jgi:hypothetical protein
MEAWGSSTTMMQHVLGNGGPSAMMRLLPYMNMQTWKNGDIF